MILSPDPSFFKHPNFQDPSVTPVRLDPGFRAWTDDYSEHCSHHVTGLPAGVNDS